MGRTKRYWDWVAWISQWADKGKSYMLPLPSSFIMAVVTFNVKGSLSSGRIFIES